MIDGLPEPFWDLSLDLPDRRDGKVRVSYAFGDDQRLLITTDRISAMDRVVGAVPYKGQVLNQLSEYWFASTADVVANHLVSVPDPNVMVVRAATPLPVEVVVRGYLTGVTSTSMWTRYERGAREIDGYRLRDGLTKNTALDTALITPTTKAHDGGHDEPISVADVVERGLVAAEIWEQVCSAALALFARGTELAAAAGVILVDTKYEFGLDVNGEVMLIDEVHTPDSSRLWVADTYAERLGAGHEPDGLDKEDVRRAVMAHHGETAEITEIAQTRETTEMTEMAEMTEMTETASTGATLPDEVVRAAVERYIDAYRRLVGAEFTPGEYPVGPRIERAIARLGE